jgi:hypothetical protein
VKSTETTVTFRKPFVLSALDAPQPAGTYRLLTDDEEIGGINSPGLRRVGTLLQIPRIASSSPNYQLIPVDPAELQAALDAETRESKVICD